MGSNLFKCGYEAAREEQERQEELRAELGKRIYRFMISSKDGDNEALVHFITEEPVTFMEHSIKLVRGGKEVYENHLCTQDDKCPYCNNGDRPSFKGALLVVDKRPYSYTNKQGKKIEGDSQLRLYVAGTKILGQLDRLSTRYGLSSRDYIITRSGKGTSTSYMFDRTDEVYTMTKKEIENILPENLREEFDGTEESLVNIIQEQLLMTLDNHEIKRGDSESEQDDSDDSSSKNLVGVKDDDEDTTPSKPKSVRKLAPSAKKRSLFKK